MAIRFKIGMKVKVLANKNSHCMCKGFHVNKNIVGIIIDDNYGVYNGIESYDNYYRIKFKNGATHIIYQKHLRRKYYRFIDD